MTSVSTDRRDGVNSSKAIKVPCAAATTGNITLNGEQTIDGINLIEGDRCLVVAQDDPAANGIYDVDEGDWTRAIDADSTIDLTEGTLVFTIGGTAGAGLWVLTSTLDIVVGETVMQWTYLPGTIGLASPFAVTLLGALNAAEGRAILGAPATTDILDWLLRSGGTMTGALTLAGAPTVNLHAATKAYADAVLTAAEAYADSLIQAWLLKSGGTMTGNLKTLTATETLVAANSGAAYAINLATSNVFEITMTDNCTFTFTNPAATGTAHSFTLKLIQDATGSRLATWPASVKWPAAIAPTLTTTAAHIDILTFLTTDGGTKYDGFVSGQNYA